MTVETNPQGNPRPARRMVGTVAGVVGVAAVAGGGVWVTQSFLAQGPQPAEALPADTLAYVAIDTDPGGEQKVEAVRLLRKFPEARSVVGGGGDLRHRIFEFLTQDGACDASYADVEPWLGNRAAFALVDAEDPKPVVVLAVDGEERREKGLDALGACFGEHSGHEVAGSWAVVAESDAVAKQVVADTAKGSLAEAPSFREWTGKAGGAGLVTMYAGPRAGSALVGVAEESPEAAFMARSLLGQGDPVGSILGGLPLFGMVSSASIEATAAPEMGEEVGAADEPAPLTKAERERLETMTPEETEAFFAKRYATSLPTEVVSDAELEAMPPAKRRALLEADQAELEGMPPMEDRESIPEDEASLFLKLPAETADALRDFGGLGGSLRFEEGTLQLKVVADHLDAGAMRVTAGSQAGALLDGLPRGLAGATAGGLADGWVDAAMGDLFGGMFPNEDDTSMERQFERSTGLDLPGDLETLGGTGVAFVAGPGFDPDALFTGEGSVPLAAVLHGDGDAIVRVLQKVDDRPRTRHRDTSRLVWKQDGNRVVVGVDRGFVDQILTGSGLASSSAFEKVLPDADKAASATYVDFDAEDWLVRAVGKHDRASAEPLHSLGFSRTITGGDDLIRVRLATD